MPKKLVAVSLFLLLTACGGGSNNSSPSAPVVASTPVPCTQTLLFQGSSSIPARTLVYQDFNIATTGRLDVIVDWTFSDSVIGVYITRTFCTVADFNSRSCSFVIQSETMTKPRKVSAPNLTPGTYYLYVGNFSTTRDESASTQLFLKSETCPPLSSVNSVGAAAFGSLETLRHH